MYIIIVLEQVCWYEEPRNPISIYSCFCKFNNDNDNNKNDNNHNYNNKDDDYNNNNDNYYDINNNYIL